MIFPYKRKNTSIKYIVQLYLLTELFVPHIGETSRETSFCKGPIMGKALVHIRFCNQFFLESTLS